MTESIVKLLYFILFCCVIIVVFVFFTILHLSHIVTSHSLTISNGSFGHAFSVVFVRWLVGWWWWWVGILHASLVLPCLSLQCRYTGPSGVIVIITLLVVLLKLNQVFIGSRRLCLYNIILFFL